MVYVHVCVFDLVSLLNICIHLRAENNKSTFSCTCIIMCLYLQLFCWFSDIESEMEEEGEHPQK